MSTPTAREQIRQTIDETQSWIDRIWALEQMAYAAATLIVDLKSCPFAATGEIYAQRGRLMEVHEFLVHMFAEVYAENQLAFDQIRGVEGGRPRVSVHPATPVWVDPSEWEERF